MRMTKTKTAAIIGGAVFAATATAYAVGQNHTEKLETVERVELNKYVGRWYEIARYPNRFQKQCTGDTTANYSVLDDGKIQVLNACRKQDGKIDQAKGKAKIVDRETNAKLKVTFFWPFYGDYWIIGLDPEYRWAVVGEPGRKYLWILSRTPQMSDADYEHALRIIRKSGYDDSKLMKTPQPGKVAEMVRR
jgi:apolipoprotein D and lipocalin family protein